MKRSELRQIIREEIQRLTEGIDNAEDFVKEIEKTIKKHFPKSYVHVYFSKNLTTSLTIRFAVGRKKDWSGGIIHNDIAHAIMSIWNIEENGDITGKLQFDPHHAGSYVISPGPDSYMAFDRIKVPVRKKTGTPEQILKSIDKYFGDLKKSLKTNFDKITPDHQKWVKKYI